MCHDSSLTWSQGHKKTPAVIGGRITCQLWSLWDLGKKLHYQLKACLFSGAEFYVFLSGFKSFKKKMLAVMLGFICKKKMLAVMLGFVCCFLRKK